MSIKRIEQTEEMNFVKELSKNYTLIKYEESDTEYQVYGGESKEPVAIVIPMSFKNKETFTCACNGKLVLGWDNLLYELSCNSTDNYIYLYPDIAYIPDLAFRILERFKRAYDKATEETKRVQILVEATHSGLVLVNSVTHVSVRISKYAYSFDNAIKELNKPAEDELLAQPRVLILRYGAVLIFEKEKEFLVIRNKYTQHYYKDNKSFNSRSKVINHVLNFYSTLEAKAVELDGINYVKIEAAEYSLCALNADYIWEVFDADNKTGTSVLCTARFAVPVYSIVLRGKEPRFATQTL